MNSTAMVLLNGTRWRADSKLPYSFYTKSYSAKTYCIKTDSVGHADRVPKTKRAPSAARKRFGQRLRQLRHARKMTLEDVGEKADIAWNYVAQVERGERNIGIDNMAALADALEIELSVLLQSEDFG